MTTLLVSNFLDVQASPATISAGFVALGKAIRKAGPSPVIEYPDHADITVADTLLLNANGGDITIEGRGARVRLAAGSWPSTTVDGHGWAQGRHLAAVTNAQSVTIRDLDLDYQASHQPAETIGDVLRIQEFGSADLARVRCYNPHGHTTRSTPTLPETFALQLLRGQSALVSECAGLALDAAPTATGLVAHWVQDVTFRESFVHGLRGQGFGTFSSHVVTFERCWADLCGHSYNVEGGPDGTSTVVLGRVGDPSMRCASTRARLAAVCVNGNPGRIGSVDVYDVQSRQDARLLSLTGTVPGRVTFTNPNVTDPGAAVLGVAGRAASAQALADRITVRSGTLHNPTGVPLISPKSIRPNAAWNFAAA